MPPSPLLVSPQPCLEEPALPGTSLFWSVLGWKGRHLEKIITLMSSDSGMSGTPKSISLQTPKTKCSKMITKRSLRAKINLFGEKLEILFDNCHDYWLFFMIIYEYWWLLMIINDMEKVMYVTSGQESDFPHGRGILWNKKSFFYHLCPHKKI